MLLAALLALGLRSVLLDSRPMHNDEAVNAIKFRNLWEGPGYRYDPNEFHGPTLAYSTLVWEKLTLAGDFARFTEIRLRSLTVLFGVGLVLLLFLVSDGLGRNATTAAALLTAVSPVLVYYSRDYIHETLFAFFIFLALASGWRYCQTGKIAWILLAGAAIGLMQATKETFVFNLAAVMGALFLNECFPLRAPATAPRKNLFRPAHLVAAGLVWLAVAVLLFTSFFSHPSGLLDAAGTYLIWFQRAQGGSPHIHGWSFYWRRLLFYHSPGGPIWSESLILLLAVWAGVAAFARRGLPGANSAFVRFLLFYTAILAVIYTVLPYKTPWSALGFWHGAILLAGVGAAALLDRLPGRRLKITGGIVFLTGVAQLAFQAWQAAVHYPADSRNPWAYAQTLPNLLDLLDKVDAVARASPDRAGLHINVIAPDYDFWPLPWYLRRYNGADFHLTNAPGYSVFAQDDIQDVHAFVEKLLDSSTFSADEIKDLSRFVSRLKGHSDPVSAFLWQGLSNPEQALLTNYPLSAASSFQLKETLVQALNKLVGGKSLYERERFQGILLRRETARLMGQSPTGANLARLNRLLLEDAYPPELSRNLLSDPVSQFLTSSGITNNVDAAHPANGDPNHLESLFVTNLNHIITGPSIYDTNRFEGIPLRLETVDLLRQNPSGPDLIRLNRRLLEDACPEGLGTNSLPVEPYPPITIVSTKLEPDMDQDKAGIMTGIYEMRPGVFLELYVQTNLWSAYLQARAK
jgi:uncharacterized protein (TIGR03663 family)